MASQERPYGSWASPISSDIAAESSVRFIDLQLDAADPETVYWTEQRSAEGGRVVVCSHTVGLGKVVDWTPSGFSARTRVHEYGGGAFFVYGRRVFFSNFSDQHLYEQSAPEAVPQAVIDGASGLRYADGQYNKQFDSIYIVQEDHRKSVNDDAATVVNRIVVIDLQNRQESVLVEGADFYSSPNVSGENICWVQWLHPNMPWDSTEIWAARLDARGKAVVDGSSRKVVGGDGLSVMCPSWKPSGSRGNDGLFYVSDQTNWWNVYLAPSADALASQHVHVTPYEKEIGAPQWMFGRRSYSNQAGAVAAAVEGEVILFEEEEQSTSSSQASTWRSKRFASGYQHIGTLGLATRGGKVFCFANDASKPAAVICIDTMTGEVSVLREALQLRLDCGYLSCPREIKIPTVEGKHCYGYYYPPQNKDFVCTDGSRPPLLVRIHGGPTSQATCSLNLSLQYFTSRGFAVLDLNYRGSTGYGRRYRDELKLKWGICDVEDSCAAAEYLSSAAVGLADPNKLCIDGGSAGGYTTLACLAFKRVFKAGASLYGVTDLEMLTKDTHKFESRYLDQLVGPYPEQRQTYLDRSPLSHAADLNCPVIFFQGDEDKVVPPNQADAMYSSLKSLGIPCAYLLFAGEQHGFRKAETIRAVLDSEFYFFCRVFNITPAEDKGKIKIANLDD